MSVNKLAVLLVIVLVCESFAKVPVVQSNLRRNNKGQVALKAIPNGVIPTKALYSEKKNKDHKKKKLSQQFSNMSQCSCESDSNARMLTRHSGSLKNFNRTYETIGTCLTTVNKLRETQRSIDYVCSENFEFETLTTYTTCLRELACTTEKRHFKVSHPTCVQRLTCRTATIQVVCPVSVTVE